MPVRRIRLVFCILSLLLVACGTPETSSVTQVIKAVQPTATETPPPPTATTAPSPTVAPTVAPAATTPPAASAPPASTATRAATATVAPTRAAATSAPTRAAASTAPSGGQIVKDEDGRCQVALPAGITEDSPDSGEFTVANDEGFGVLLSTDNPNPADFTTVVESFLTSFTGVFTNYQATNTAKTPSTYRVDFTGELVRTGQGIIYFKQVNQVACGFILFVYDGTSFPYAQAVATMIGTLDALKR